MSNENQLEVLYRSFRLAHYKSLFGKIREKAGSLSATESFAVDVIYLLGEPTIKQFSDYLGISQPNASYKVASLISKGYIEKLPSAEDKREFRLRVTDHFFDYYNTENLFLNETQKVLDSALTPEEHQSFCLCLEKLNLALSKVRD